MLRNICRPCWPARTALMLMVAVVPVARAQGPGPDPTQLPVALVNHAMNTAAYEALNVRGMALGASYRDPVTKVRITRLTNSTFPTDGSWGLAYFEGGWSISLPYLADGVTRAVMVYGAVGATSAIIDFTPGKGVGRGGILTGALTPARDLCFTFSNNPATPYYAYVLNRGTLRRMDIRSMTEAPGGGFPLTGVGDGGWLQQSENDGEFVWMENHVTHHFTPATGRHITLDEPAANEPRLSRAGRYVGLSMNRPQNGLRMWDAQTNTVTWSSDGSLPFAHNGTLKNLWVGSAWNDNYPFALTSVTPTPNSFKREWVPSIGDLPVWNGGWLQPGDQRAAWIVGNSYGSLSGKAHFPNLGWTAPGGIVLATMNGERRLLAHPYSNQANYQSSAWPQFSADGRIVVFASDMLGSGRYDVFAIELPTR